MSQFETLVTQFIQRIEYPDEPATRPDGSRAFRFGQLVVWCKDEGESCLLSGAVTEIPSTDPPRGERLRRLLKVSLAVAAQENACLALDAPSDTLLLYHRFPLAGKSPAEFEAEVEEFLNRLEFWVEQARREAAPAHAPSAGLVP